MKTNREIYKRFIIFIEILILFICFTGIYTYVWDKFYEDTILIPFFRRGNLAMIIIYPLMLMVFGKISGVFRVAVASRIDMVFSNIFNLLLTNTAVYFMLVALVRHYISVTNILVMSGVEVVLAVCWIIGVKALNNVLFPAHNLLLIHGDYSLKELVYDINKRSERYQITEEININNGMDAVIRKMEEHDAVLISDLPAETRNDILKYCYNIGKRVYMLPKITDIIVESCDKIHLFDNMAFVSKNFGLSAEQRILKRALDLFVSGIMIICFSWLMAIIAAAIKIGDGGPVFYKQDRLTRDGKVFQILKFRSMRTDAEKAGPQLSTKNDSRVTPVGKVLRASHMDELPQLFNVFKSDMSMVGPRPERPEIAREYAKNVPEFNYRLKTKAGLTGYAQVYGRYNSTPYNKLRLDLTYIQNYTIWLDIKCIIMTVKILFVKEAREGVDEDQKTAEKSIKN